MTENAPLPPEEIERLKTLLEKAGSGHVFVYRGEDGEAIAIADLATRRDICRFGVPHRKITREWIEGHAELLAGVLNALPALLAGTDALVARVDQAQELEAGLRDMLPYAEAGTWRVLPDKIRALLAEIETGRAGAERMRELEAQVAALKAERDEAVEQFKDGVYAIADGCIYGIEAHDIATAVAMRVRLYSDDEYLEIEKGQEIIDYLLTEARNCTQIGDQK